MEIKAGTVIREKETGETHEIRSVIKTYKGPTPRLPNDTIPAGTILVRTESEPLYQRRFLPGTYEIVSVPSIFDIYRTEPDVIFPIPAIGGKGRCGRGDMLLAVGKVGSGTLGRFYEGFWYMEVIHDGKVVYSSEELQCGTPMTHLQAAVMFASIVSPWEGEEDNAEYPFGERLREWLNNCVERDILL